MKELYGETWNRFSDCEKLSARRQWIAENPEEAKKHMTWKKWQEVKDTAAERGIVL